MRGLEGKNIIVAGSATGLGAATANRLAEHGARLVLADRDLARATENAEAIRASGGTAFAAYFDLGDEDSIRAMTAQAVADLGGIDSIHVNAADLTILPQDTNAVDIDMAVFDRTIHLNLRGHLLLTRHAIPHIVARGGGAVVYTSSDAAFEGEAIRPSYAVSKSGLHALVRHVASGWGKQGIRANAVLPGLVVTDHALELTGSEEWDYWRGRARSKRLGKPNDIAAMTAFLMSDDGQWVNGQMISVNGGILLR